MKIKIVSIILFLFVAMVCCMHTKKTDGDAANYTYVGTDKCQSCHPKEYKDYSVSFHFHAMDTASAASVKADFNNSFFVYYGDTTYFYKKGDQLYVRTTDSTSVKKDLYSFSVQKFITFSTPTLLYQLRLNSTNSPDMGKWVV